MFSFSAPYYRGRPRENPFARHVQTNPRMRNSFRVKETIIPYTYTHVHTRVGLTRITTGMAQKIRSAVAVESLVEQCYHYVAMNLEKFPVGYLSLLPLKVREELLWRLPIADLCLLEDTEYVDGFQDLAAYWKLPFQDFMKAVQNHADVARYVEEWDSIEYAKAILYGQVAVTAFGCLYDAFIADLEYCSICLPFNGRLDPNVKDVVVPLLYAVRKPFVGSKSGCGLAFPPRYRDKDRIIWSSKKGIVNSMWCSNKFIVNSVRGCFKSGFPKVMLQVCIREDIDSEYFGLLDEVALIATNNDGFILPTLRLVEQVVCRSSCLEVIMLDSCLTCEYEQAALNRFLKFLSTQDGFLSRFRLLVITQEEEYYTIFQENLGPLITAYFSAPTTHPQKIEITGAKIKSYDTDVAPLIDQRYVQFKTIALKGCYYYRKFSPKAVTEWLGEDVSILNEDKESSVDSLTFKVREKATDLPGKKRKHSEVDDED